MNNVCFHIERDLPFVDRLKAALDRGLSPDALDVEGYPLLSVCARRDIRNVPRYLLDAGADPNIAGPGGLTPLHFAAGLGHFFVLQRLIAYGAYLDLSDDAGDTALHFAARRLTAAAAFALSGEASNLRFPRHIAFRKLLEPVYAARLALANPRPPESVRWLLAEKTIDVKSLLVAGADPSCFNSAWETPLHLAAEGGFERVCRALLDAGVNTAILDRKNRLAEGRAREAGHTEIADLLSGRQP